LGLGTAAGRGKQEVKLPLYLMDTLTNGIFNTAVFSVNFPDTCLQFKEIKAPAGSLLEGVPFSASTAPGTVRVEILERRVVSAQSTPRLLAELTFTAGNPAGANPVTCPVELAGWVFNAGCFRPLLHHGEITITPRRPDVACDNQLMPLIGWEKSLDAYSPVPVRIAAAVKNVGDGEAEGFRLTIIHDDADFMLINPSTTTQNGSPAAIAPAGSAGAKWDVRIPPRATTDSVVVQFLAEFNNHPAVLCSNKLFIPASVPVVKPAGSTRFCIGDSVVLDAVAGYAGYSWSDGSVASSTVARTGGLYHYTARDAGGRTIQSDTIMVRVFDPPVPEILPRGPITLCEGSSIQLGASGAFARYLWSTGATTRTIIVSQAGSYSVSVVDGNGCAGTSSPVVIAVVPAPKVEINGASSACAGSTHGYIAGGTPNMRYRWSVENGRILSGQETDTALVKWGSASQGAVVVTATDTANACAVSDTLVTALHSLPRPALSHNGSLSLCEGDSVVLDAGAGYAAYGWSNGAASVSIVVSTAGGYFVEVTDTNGCAGMSDTVFVSIVKRPAPEIQGPLMVCRNTQAVYTTSGKADTISWEVSGGSILSGGRDSAVTVMWGAVDSAWIKVTAVLNGCSGSSFENVMLSDSLKPVVSASGPLQLCEGGTVALDAGAGYVAYRGSNGLRTRAINGSKSGVYSVYVADAAGCAGTSDPVIVTVHPLPPEPVITRSRDTLFATVGPYTYQWNESGAPLTGATGRMLLIPAAGSYTVSITDSNGCGSVSQPHVVPTLSVVDPVRRAFTFDLYPDPNNGTAQLSIHTEHPRDFELVLTDCLGRAVSHMTLHAAAGSARTLLDLSTAPPGVYMLRIISGEGMAMRKLLRL